MAAIILGAISGGLGGVVGILLFKLFGGDPDAQQRMAQLAAVAGVVVGLFLIRPQLAGFVVGFQCGQLEVQGPPFTAEQVQSCRRVGVELAAE